MTGDQLTSKPPGCWGGQPEISLWASEILNPSGLNNIHVHSLVSLTFPSWRIEFRAGNFCSSFHTDRRLVTCAQTLGDL